MSKFYNRQINEVWKSLDDDGKEAMLLFGKQCADAAIHGMERGYKRGFKQGVGIVFLGAALSGMVYDWWKQRNKNSETDQIEIDTDFIE